MSKISTANELNISEPLGCLNMLTEYLTFPLSALFSGSFEYGTKPFSEDRAECSGHRKCNGGCCICDPFFRGEACNIAACPNDYTANEGHERWIEEATLNDLHTMKGDGNLTSTSGQDSAQNS
uniref:Uncharacterized protein n=1 Tax=Glossina austeni TaxID=7395 RepID=A0A1A9UFM5_GLOAU